MVVESLLADLLASRIPPGRHLVTQQLAERFGVSHTPIREALVELAGMGVVDLLPNRGALVRQMTAHDVREICQVRRALECAAVRGASGRISAAQLSDLARDMRRLARVSARSGLEHIAEARELDSRLHDLVAAHCGNAFLAHELNRLKLLFRALRDASWDRYESRRQWPRVAAEAREHLAVVKALAAGDRPAAVRAMGTHLRSAARYWCRVVASAQAQFASAEARPRTAPMMTDLRQGVDA